MSFWDKYFAPGDLRQRRQQQETQLLKQPVEAEKVIVIKPPPPARISPADRVRRQNGLLYGGAAFTLLSLFVTRRALNRKLLAAQMSADSTAAQQPQVDGSLEAIQALGYATLNTFSMALLGIGAAMTYFDIADLEDMRQAIRQQSGYGEEEENDREIEGWIAEVLARRDGKGSLREGVAEKVAEIERKRKVEEQLQLQQGRGG